MMKQWLAFVVLAGLSASVLGQSPLVEPDWEKSGLRTPESVLVHQREDGPVLLVSEIEGKPTEQDGQGGIALMSPEGEMIDQDYIRGLDAPKGMAIHGDTLYVSDITELVAIDWARQTVTARYPVEDSVFLNDVAVDAAGRVYVSDTRTNKVHRLEDGEISLYLEDMSAANGLYTQGESLFVGAGSELYRVDGNGKTLLADGFAEAIDGVEALAGGGFVVSCWAGLVYHVSPEGKLTQWLDTRGTGVNTADIGYDGRTHTLYVPTFGGQSVRAYSL